MAKQLVKAVGRLDPDLTPFVPLIGDATHIEMRPQPPRSTPSIPAFGAIAWPT